MLLITIFVVIAIVLYLIITQLLNEMLQMLIYFYKINFTLIFYSKKF